MREHAEPFPKLSRLNPRAQAGANTTIAIVATNADLTNVEAKRVAMMAHDGIARAVRPAHTAFDGDIVFAVASAAQKLPQDAHIRHGLVARIGAAASDCLTRAIARAIYEASR
jgi:L-aminopeptidase/D-esterase-like protein